MSGEHLIGDNSHGYNNEQGFVNYLNCKKFSELNLCMKKFIKDLSVYKGVFVDDDTIITARKETDNQLKQDIYIYINGVQINVSCKMGSGNSCHQEKIEDFVRYITNVFNATDKICNEWKFFIWADGTTDGTGSTKKGADGNIVSRFGCKQYKKQFPESRSLLQNFVNLHERELLDRVIFVGAHDSKVDFVIHGDYRDAVWMSKNEILDYLVANKKTSSPACLRLCNLTIQPWNISQKGTTENKRGQIQVKYGDMEKDFRNMIEKKSVHTGTFQGDGEEFNLVKELNKNKNSKLWKVFNIEKRDNVYAVRVSKKHYSKLSKQNVLCKSDAYLISGLIGRYDLLSKGFMFDENDLQNFKFSIIPESGISIKLKESNRYTFHKFTVASFEKAFAQYTKSPKDLMLDLLVFSTKKEIYKNRKLISDFGINYNLYIHVNMMKYKFSRCDVCKKEFWDVIRSNAQRTLHKIIIDNVDLAKSIFYGSGWFDDPYYASYIFEGGELKQIYIPDFIITTGSGRSKGIYTIELKPKS